jgi:hypothetical protein
VYTRFLHKLGKTGEHCRTKYEKRHIYMTELSEQPHEIVLSEIRKGADEAFIPVRPEDSPLTYANLVVEVGWCESLNDLDDDAQLWLSPHTTVQVRNTIMDVKSCMFLYNAWRMDAVRVNCENMEA